MIIYCIKNKINKKQYVGLTTKSSAERWKDHVNHAKYNSKNMPIARAILKHGKENFEIFVLEECLNLEKLNEKEIFWITELNTYNEGYNATLGGGASMLGRKHSEETKQKISKAIKGKIRSKETRQKMSKANSGEKNSMFGKTHSEKIRQKISETNKGENHPFFGKQLSEIHRQKISKSHKGKKHSEASKKKMSEARKGYKHSEETKKKIGKANKGKKHSEKPKKKMSKSLMGTNHRFFGKHHSEETKQKISKANKGENNPRAKLIKNEVLQIKDLLSKGGITQQSIADKFGVTKHVISKIKRGKTWRHIK